MTDAGDKQISRFALLLDTNEFIALEPAARAPEAGLSRTADLVRLAHEGGHRFFISSATIRDFQQDTDISRRATNLSLARKYPTLERIDAPATLLTALGESAPPAGRDSNDDRDLEMLCALWVDAVDFLVTDDNRLRRRGNRAGLADRIVTAAEAAELLEGLAPRITPPPPAVEALISYQLRLEDPIFDSLRLDYPDFDSWMRKARADHRQAWVIRSDGGYGAVMIVKEEDHGEYGLPGKILKLSTFKVSESVAGRSYGELLLKTLFIYLRDGEYDTVYVTAFPKQARLVDLLEAFGFTELGHRTSDGQLILAKFRRPADTTVTDHLEAHRKHGPPYIHPSSLLFVVPIQPHWHDALFPEFDMGGRLDVWGDLRPYGNALRKAYVSGARTRKIKRGDTLLFYRTDDLRAVTVVGVVEDVRVSSDPEAITRFVGRRTVYTASELAAMADQSGELHAMIFRQDRILDPVWAIRTLEGMGVLNGHPQSITEARTGGRTWVHQELDVSQ